MKYLFTYIFMVGYIACMGQGYYSKIIPTIDNPLVKVLKKVDDRYIIPTDFFSSTGVRGGVIIVEQGNCKKIKYDKIDLGASPIVISEGSMFLVGENPLQDGDSLLQLVQIDTEEYSIDWCKGYYVGAPITFNTSINLLEGNIYTLNVNNLIANEATPRELLLLSIKKNGEFRWSKKINTHARLTLGWMMVASKNKNLIISSSINYFDKLGRYSQLIKISQEGEIIWNYEGTERLDNGAVPTWATELSDTTILQTYYVDRHNDVDFIANNWFRVPNKFIWLDKNGNLIREKLIITDREDFLYYDGVKRGDKDYYFAYGYHEDRRPLLLDQFYCHLTKFSNSGDTIWTRNYQHPLYPDGNVVHTIKDIIEEENGDITVLADISAPLSKIEVWLFRLNSEGCYVNEDCEDMRDHTSTTTTALERTVLSPNPTSGMLHIKKDINIKKVSIYDITGKQYYEEWIDAMAVEIDLSEYANGVYIFHILDANRKVTTQKIIKME